MRSLLIVVVGLFMVGCRPATMNKKMAYTDSGATLATAVVLDEVAEVKYDITKAKTIEVAEALKKFVESGNLSELPLVEVEKLIHAFMIKQDWQDYIHIVDAAIQYVRTQQVDVDKIGVNNIELIKCGLDATIRSAQRSRKDWR